MVGTCTGVYKWGQGGRGGEKVSRIGRGRLGEVGVEREHFHLLVLLSLTSAAVNEHCSTTRLFGFTD